MQPNAPTDTSLDNAQRTGINEVNAAKTVELYLHKHGAQPDKFPLNFRGDIAERHQYDKILPQSPKPERHGHVIVIEGQSHKTGAKARYQILANQWNLLEVVAKLD